MIVRVDIYQRKSFFLHNLSSGEWKPIFNNTSTSKERISVMQIAFADEIFLVDMLNFFHQCDTQTVQERLANRLFDDDHVTILCELEEKNYQRRDDRLF